MLYTTSTKEDIYENLPAIKEYAKKLLDQHIDKDEDWWDALTVDDKAFDFNVFDWQSRDYKVVTCVTVYPVINMGECMETDTANFVRLYQRDKQGKVWGRAEVDGNRRVWA